MPKIKRQQTYNKSYTPQNKGGIFFFLLSTLLWNAKFLTNIRVKQNIL